MGHELDGLDSLYGEGHRPDRMNGARPTMRPASDGMSGDGRPDAGDPAADGLRVGVVATSWHGEITDTLLERAVWLATQAGATTPTVVRVPGCVEMPVVAQALATSTTPWSRSAW